MSQASDPPEVVAGRLPSRRRILSCFVRPRQANGLGLGLEVPQVTGAVRGGRLRQRSKPGSA